MSVRSPRLVVLPPDPGRKTRHLAVVTHEGNGWWTARCMGSGKRCRAGECKHIANMRFREGGRRIRPMPRDAEVES